MQKTYSLSEKIQTFLIIFFPIFITQISLTATHFVDTVMSGQVSHYDLAGVAIGTNLWHPVFTGINGTLSGLTPILSQLNGAGRRGEMPFLVIQGIYLALTLGFGVIGVGSIVLLPILDMMNLEPSVHRIAQHFLQALALGIVPVFVSAVLRNFIDSLGYTRITMLITLVAVPINIAFNYLLIPGNYGFPKLGGVGAGYGSALTYWCLAIISICVVHYKAPFKGYRIFAAFPRISLTAWKELIGVGLPIGLAIFCEVSIFAVVALLMAQYGTAVIAAHQAAINFAGLVYMVPLSIGITLTILVGFEAGARRYRDARQYAYLGIGLSTLIGVVFTIVLVAFNREIASMYANEPSILELIRNFLVYAIFFQLSDAIAAPIQGSLRGYKDVKVTLLMAIISYWFIGMPVGYLLAQYSALAAYGYWIGFIAGLAVGAVVLMLRLVWLQKKYKRSFRNECA